MNTKKLICPYPIFIMLVAILSVIGVSEAANVTYFVDSSIGNNNSKCGAQARPCKTITYTVNNKAQQNDNSTINIAAGTYNETIFIEMKNVFLNGVAKTSTFIVGNTTTPTISAAGPTYVQIANLTIKNGKPGIKGNRASIECLDTDITDSFGGITVQANSSLDFNRGLVMSQQLPGITVRQSSTANINNTTIKESPSTQANVPPTTNGFSMDSSSSANIVGTTISGNYQGIVINSGSSAFIQDSIIEKNRSYGISVAGNSVIRLAGKNKVQLNGGYADPITHSGGLGGGIIIGQSSQISIQSTTPDIEKDIIQGNAGNGISVVENSVIDMFDGIIHNNESNGIALGYNSTAYFAPSSTTITNNGGLGLSCNANSIFHGDIGTLTENNGSLPDQNVIPQAACQWFP